MHYDTIRPEYFLKKWQYYETARYELSNAEMNKAKIFFNALKQLSDGDRAILSDVYYYSKQPCTYNEKTGHYHSLRPVKSEGLATKYGVTVNEFKKMKRIAQVNLKKEMQKVIKAIGNKFVFRMNSHLYLVDVIDRGARTRQYVLGHEFEAKVYEQSEKYNEMFNTFLYLGFEKVPASKEGVY